ncbi:MAG: hypothetical protein WCR60_01930 [Patescibacteria group bacterium]|jgi:hypothetical protein
MRKNASRLFVFVLTFVVACSLSARPAQASIWDWIKAQFQSEEASSNMKTSITQEGVSGEKHVTETTSNLMNVINLHVMGIPESEEGGTETSMLRDSVGSGLIGTVNSGIIAMYDPPASSKIYVADLLQNAKIIPQAQAQGLGFSSLNPILETWKSFRNIAYLFFVVIFLVIGFMIMFRAKIGQAAITVQQAIPSIVVALLAVTFSYAIAGFLIDLMYLLMYMLATLFDGGADLITGNFFTLVSTMFTGFWGNMETAVTNLMDGLLGQKFLGQGALRFLSTLSATVIVGLAILLGTFKIFFELLKSYIAIILQVVFAPIILMIGAIPGQNPFFSWIKGFIGNLAMWPIVMICLLVNRMLTQGTHSSGGFMPPFLIGEGQAETIPILIGVGILLVIPEIMKEVKKKLGVEDGIMGSLAGAAGKQIQQGWKFGKPVLGGGLSAATGLGGGALGAIGGFATAGEGATMEDRFKKAGQSGLKGLTFGAAAPTVISKTPKLLKGTLDTAFSQGQEALSKRGMNIISETVQKRETRVEKGAEDAITGELGYTIKQKPPGRISNSRSVPRPIPTPQANSQKPSKNISSAATNEEIAKGVVG